MPLMEARPWADGKTITYRYHPIGAKPINLGTDRTAAIRKVADMLGQGDNQGTLRWVWEKYSDPDTGSPRWKKMAEVTKEDYRQAWKQIDKSLGDMQMPDITSPIVARYVHVERADAPKRANTEKALLSNLFGHGIKLGACSSNATIGVEPHQIEARTEAPDGKLLDALLAWMGQQTTQRKLIGMAAEYASLAGNRKCEFLKLTWPQVDREAKQIRVIRAKQRGKKRETIVEVIAISHDMEALLIRLEALRPGRECLYVFPTRDGNKYSDKGFQSIWQRCIQDAIADKVLTAANRFTFHDLRAYYTTKHKLVRGELPDLHANPETTARVYDRNKEVFRSSN